MGDTESNYKAINHEGLQNLSKHTGRTSRVVLRAKPTDLPVYEIPVKYLYFNIENGRYADRMLKLRADNPGVLIDPRQSKWRDEIKGMLLGTSKHSMPVLGDKPAAERLKTDIEKRTQLVPGLVGLDGGVLDGNRRLAVLIELGKEYFDGVILPAETSLEDKWRLEAGLQLGKPIVHDYSPVNELLKVREGLEIFKKLKKDGRDPAPNKSPEELVAEAIYGRDVKEIKEWLARIELMDQYLEFLGKKGRYYLIGDRSERFLETVKLIEAAKKQGCTPKEMKNLKGWLFHQIQERSIDNWELRKIYKIIGGDPTRKGKKPTKKTKARDDLIRKLPDSDKLRDICIENATLEDAVMTQGKKADKHSDLGKREKYKDISGASLSLADEVLEAARKETEEETPIKNLEQACDRLDSVRSSTHVIKNAGKTERALQLLNRIDTLAKDCKQLLKK